ncbi:toll/interleukin-1 receptor domain-containing protein [Caenimonas sedimenti]|uniref:Toll/interleukin-1 receptor domain-containing protein n=1 Tax=Caenimonas sedimenti TaxID=2596921 RepID=A0A562ZTV4_9BURK|nr:toll/interleukin-1 receptor domain-containing protein [Caenimonas sedimenti]TWO71768.1 toll/interleukin-1 receptor domain-containing protein [Caenimonas sedimenti]
MSSIFISYRSSDFDRGVLMLYGRLAERFGAEHLTLDRLSFAPGANWLPQIRSRVAMADIVVCAMGPGWTGDAAAPAFGVTDYVLEELALARKLGKPVLPVALAVDPLAITRSLPAGLEWVSDLHFVRFDPMSGDAKALCEALDTLGGPTVVRDASNGQAFGFGTKLVLDVSRSVLGSIFRPIGHAAAALQPVAGLRRSFLLAGAALTVLCLSGLLVAGEINPFMVAKFLAAMAFSALVAFAAFGILSWPVKGRPSSGSIASFTLHCTAALYIALAAWLLVFWLVLPDAVHHRFAAIGDSDLPLMQQLESLDTSLTTGAKWRLGIVQACGLLHLLILVNAFSRAAAIALGWKRWVFLLPASAVGVGFVAILVVLLTSGEGLRGANLPMDVTLTSAKDVMEPGGLKKTELLLEATGRIEKRPKSIAFVVDSFRAENRQLPAKPIQALMCALLISKGGRFDWPPVMHEARVRLGEDLAPGQGLSRRNLVVDVPLGENFQSGATALGCFVETGPVSYPIGNGTMLVLKW